LYDIGIKNRTPLGYGHSQLVNPLAAIDIVPALQRVEIGYTWYAKRCQRSHVNSVAKLLLMTHAFEAVGCKVVGWRTDNFNFASQAAIERLGAQKDGVIRGHALRRDGTIRDTVMYSMRSGEWPEAKAQFLKATELDPKYPDAHYWLGMALVNEGNMAEAGTHMKDYLALAPTGQYVDTAKAILDSIK